MFLSEYVHTGQRERVMWYCACSGHFLFGKEKDQSGNAVPNGERCVRSSSISERYKYRTRVKIGSLNLGPELSINGTLIAEVPTDIVS